MSPTDAPMTTDAPDTNAAAEGAASFAAIEAQALARLDELSAVRRLAARDASLWSSDLPVQAAVRNRLGWLAHLPAMREQVRRLAGFARACERHGYDRALVIGMGGSSLWPEVVGRHLRTRRGVPVRIIDSTHPGAAQDALDWAAEGEPLFIVATKSGGTVETLSLYRVARARFDDGKRFVAITDPGSPLVALAEAEGFRELFLNPADIGGRFSATSLFGLVPAALAGVDLGAALDAAEQELASCLEPAAARNPAAQLAAFLYAGHATGRHLVRLSLSKDIAGFASWIEQLVAESTGKAGLGLLPVPGALPEGTPAGALAGTVVVGQRTFRHPDDPFVDACQDAGVPAFDVVMPEPSDLWAEVMRWQVATALVGVLLGINPFDEPDVSAAKQATNALLAGERAPAAPGREVAAASVKALAGALAPELEAAEGGSFLAVLAYLAPTEANLHRLAALRERLQQRTAAAVTVQPGPRYLHSTGQLHKGGPALGRYVIVHDGFGDPSLEIPGGGSLHTLLRAQALGDVTVLSERDRPVTVASVG